MPSWFKASGVRGPRAGGSGDSRKETLRIRPVVVVIIAGCALSVLACLVHLRHGSAEPVPPSSGQAGIGPGPLAPTEITHGALRADQQPTVAAAIGSVNFAAAADTATLQVAGVATAEPPAIDPASFTDPSTLATFLRNADPVLGALQRLRARLTFEVIPLAGDVQPVAAVVPGAAGGRGA